MGFTMAFKNESTAATIKAIRGVSTRTPFKKYELTITASAETNSFSINFIYLIVTQSNYLCQVFSQAHYLAGVTILIIIPNI